jgi:ATP-binding cassette subfamily B protein RaxB
LVFLNNGKSLDTQKHYRSQIAAVMQDDQLISGDIAENIACFSPVVDMQKVYFCTQLACVHEDIMKMPMHYHTLVGDMGTSLSGGQKQRIILARALYREPRVLFMDETTSHLDVKNESVVNHHIQQLPITRVMVAHRPETVASAGRQINLADHGD